MGGFERAKELVRRWARQGELPTRAARVREVDGRRKRTAYNQPIVSEAWFDIDGDPGDWQRGSLSHSNGTLLDHRRQGLYLDGVEVGRPELAALADRLPESTQLPAPTLSDAAPPDKHRGGRKAAHWWPDFAEELTVYIYESGLPPGDGTEGQSVVINAVFERMVKRGLAEPGRSAVQGAVSNVLKRCRQPATR